MNFKAISALALASTAMAQYANVTITSEIVVTELTTYCPEPTTIVTNNKTIIVTTPGTITITDCPCTISTTEITDSTPAGSSTPVVSTTTKKPSTEKTTTTGGSGSSSTPAVITNENVAGQVGVAGVALAAAAMAALV